MGQVIWDVSTVKRYPKADGFSLRKVLWMFPVKRIAEVFWRPSAVPLCTPSLQVSLEPGERREFKSLSTSNETLQRRVASGFQHLALSIAVFFSTWLGFELWSQAERSEVPEPLEAIWSRSTTMSWWSPRSPVGGRVLCFWFFFLDVFCFFLIFGLGCFLFWLLLFDFRLLRITLWLSLDRYLKQILAFESKRSCLLAIGIDFAALKRLIRWCFQAWLTVCSWNRWSSCIYLKHISVSFGYGSKIPVPKNPIGKR